MPTKPTIETEAINIVFKMHEDGRMDEEEAKLVLDVIFSGQLDAELFNILRFIYKVRPFDDGRIPKDLQSIPIVGSPNDYQGTAINIVKKQKGEICIEITIEGFDNE